MENNRELAGRRWVVPAFAAVVAVIILLSAVAERFESGSVTNSESTYHLP
jgi:hypothetical protein